jgi:hypothetical protein
MNQRDSDAATLVGGVGLPIAPPEAGPEQSAHHAGEEPDGEIQELLDYLPVPLRPGETRQVQFRQGGRLRPLPYPLDMAQEEACQQAAAGGQEHLHRQDASHVTD